MAGSASLGEFEQVVLLAILRLSDTAYGVSIRREILERIGRDVAPGALFTTLERLEEKGFISARFGDPTPQRGGRAKRYFKVSSAGLKAITNAQRGYQRLLAGIELPGLSHA